MATTAAIGATSEAIRSLLARALADSVAFANVGASHFQAEELQEAIKNETTAVSVYLHRVIVSATRRNLRPGVGPQGERVRPPISVDLSYLVSAWGPSPLVQQTLLGFAIRAIEDTPILPPTLLNDGGFAGVFRTDETVELVWAPLTVQDEADVWQVAQQSQQPSAHYVARGVEIESLLAYPEPPLVQTRDLEFGVVRSR
jgi:hypothetical protein